MLSKIKLWPSALTLCLLLASTVVQAYKVTPLVIHMEPFGDGSKTFLTIENTHQYSLTVELLASLRHVAYDGSESETDAEDDFLIFPPQAIIEPGQSQRIQIQYVGGPLQQSRPYRVTIQQVPVRLDTDAPVVNFNFIFKSAIYVVPDQVDFDLNVNSLRQLDDGKYLVEVENKGNRHAVLTTGDWTARSASGTEQTIVASTVETLRDSPIIEANSSRQLVFLPEFFNELADIQSLEINPAR